MVKDIYGHRTESTGENTRRQPMRPAAARCTAWDVISGATRGFWVRELQREKENGGRVAQLLPHVQE